MGGALRVEADGEHCPPPDTTPPRATAPPERHHREIRSNQETL